MPRGHCGDAGDRGRLYRRLVARVDMIGVAASFVIEKFKETTETPLGYA
jgi:Lrp/AsnC family transcriptional regulator